ncbi:MAG: penicillin-binding protein 2 [Nocardioides sp.]
MVLQVLVFSLFATLFTRLYYLQVVSGDSYQAKAASQSVREIVQQPPRGLIVDAQGRPLVANRSAWSIAIDRTMLDKLAADDRGRLVARVAQTIGVKRQIVEDRLVSCGAADAKADVCWNGSPFQPVPVADDVRSEVALRIMEQPEDFPAVIASQQSLRSYPRPFGVNLAHALGYLSPVTEDEFDLAQKHHDDSINGASVVGRAGVEKSYDRFLRGVPGYERVVVDSMGRVMGADSTTSAAPGDTLVTSLDAKVQGVVEKQLAEMIRLARLETDKVTGRKFAADAGSAIVMEARTGRIVAMASQPTYDPSTWVGGISERELQRLYSKQANYPLLSRVTQGQYAPGSTWKPIMSAGALTHGYSTDTRLGCPSSLRIGNRVFKNFESTSAASISFAQALEMSCNTFFYQVGYHYWQKYGSKVDDVRASDPLVAEAKKFGFGRATGIDIPGEASGRIADRKWKRAYWQSQKDYYCELSKNPEPDTTAYMKLFAREFCAEGYAYRAGDAANFAIGQGDTMVTPLQMATAYAAIANGGTLYAPRIGKAIVDPQGRVVKQIKPKVASRVGVPKRILDYIDSAMQDVSRTGTMSWRLVDFPLDQVTIRSKTGTAEVYGKQTTGWVGSYTKDYVVVMNISQGGTGSGSTGPAIRAIYEALYGVEGTNVNPKREAIPGLIAPDTLPTFRRDGSILPPAPTEAGGA